MNGVWRLTIINVTSIFSTYLNKVVLKCQEMKKSMKNMPFTVGMRLGRGPKTLEEHPPAPLTPSPLASRHFKCFKFSKRVFSRNIKRACNFLNNRLVSSSCMNMALGSQDISWGYTWTTNRSCYGWWSAVQFDSRYMTHIVLFVPVSPLPWKEWGNVMAICFRDLRRCKSSWLLLNRRLGLSLKVPFYPFFLCHHFTSR